MNSKTSEASVIFNSPNVITLIRILLVPLFVAILLSPWPEWFGIDRVQSYNWKSIVAAIVFVVISCTDWLDGYLARKKNQVTTFGKFIDPLADKILVASALVALVELGNLPTWVVLVFLAREFIVSGIRMIAAAEGVVIQASILGKCKTVFQMIAIVLFTIKDSHMIGSVNEALEDGLWVFSWIIMAIALVLTVVSMMEYLLLFKKVIGTQKSYIHFSKDIQDISQKCISLALEKSITLASAESLTGGMIGSALTSIPGSSSVYKGAVVSYTNEIKNRILHVDNKTLETYTAVSSETAHEMVSHIKELYDVDIAVAVTGIAGPGGGSETTPVGTVWVGIAVKDTVETVVLHLEGTRDEIRSQVVVQALRLVYEKMDQM